MKIVITIFRCGEFLKERLNIKSAVAGEVLYSLYLREPTSGITNINNKVKLDSKMPFRLVLSTFSNFTAIERSGKARVIFKTPLSYRQTYLGRNTGLCFNWVEFDFAPASRRTAYLPYLTPVQQHSRMCLKY